MEFSGIGASNGWMAGCFECTARAVASHLQGRQDWYAFSNVGGPWQHGHCDNPMGHLTGLIPPQTLTPATFSDYETPSLSPPLSPEDMLANPLPSLGLDHDSLADFGSEFVSSPQKEESLTSPDEKNERPSTMRRMRRREQNRESQRRFRDRKESYTKQLEKKIIELEGISATLQSELARISDMAGPGRGGGAKNVPSQCPKSALENCENLEISAQVQEVAVAS